MSNDAPRSANKLKIWLRERESTDANESEAETYHCGVNGCSREVDSEDATCWQHQR